jgi:Flp pilus assembly protein TadD
VAFGLALLVIGYAGYAINFGEIGRTLSTRFFEKALLAEVEEKPTNPKLHNALASLYYQEGAYQEAIAHYEAAIGLAPRNVEALNNLAWLYATCEEEAYRNASKALLYAKAAAVISPVPHVLDTLAESHYVNGRYREAVAVIEEVIRRGPPDEDYYRRQREKFRQAVKQRYGP